MPRPSKNNGTRRCIATGKTVDKAELIRFALASDGRVVADLSEQLPGRGVWLGANRELVDRAISRGLFCRGFRQSTRTDNNLADRIEDLLTRRVIDLLGMSRRAGQSVTGFEKCRVLLRQDPCLILHARDASLDGLNKLAGDRSSEAIRVMNSTELGVAFNRSAAVHVALVSGRLSNRVKRECCRLGGFRGQAMT